MFKAISPAGQLAPFVHAYWFVDDFEGNHAGRAIHTSPLPGAILTVNFGRPNAPEGALTSPRVSLLGLQTEGRRWRSWPDTCFVMVMLTVPGLARLFPRVGAD